MNFLNPIQKLIIKFNYLQSLGFNIIQVICLILNYKSLKEKNVLCNSNLNKHQNFSKKICNIVFFDEKIYNIFPNSKNPCLLINTKTDQIGNKNKIFYKFMPIGYFDQKKCFWICEDYIESLNFYEKA